MNNLQLSVILILSILISLTSGQEGGHDQPPDNEQGSGDGKPKEGEEGYQQGFNRGIKPYSYGYNTGVKPYSYNFYQPLGGNKTEQHSGGEEENGKETFINETSLISSRESKIHNEHSDRKKVLVKDNLIQSENRRNEVQPRIPGAVYDDEPEEQPPEQPAEEEGGDGDINQDNDQKESDNEGEEDNNHANQEANNESDQNNQDPNEHHSPPERLPPSPSPPIPKHHPGT